MFFFFFSPLGEKEKKKSLGNDRVKNKLKRRLGTTILCVILDLITKFC
jgi:hypothetical protein